MSGKYRPFSVSFPQVLAVSLALVTACAIANAGDVTPAGQSPDFAFPLSPNSVLKGDHLIVGDVHPVPATEAEALTAIAPTDDSMWDRCVQNGPTWFRESEDGTQLELQWPWGVRDKHRLLTAQCEDGSVTIGGYALTGPQENLERRAMFFLYDRNHNDPVTITLVKHLTVGVEQITLTEVRAIDSQSRRILFAATTKSGTELYVIAPYRWAKRPPGANQPSPPGIAEGR